MEKKKLIELLKDLTEETTIDWLKDWVLKAEREDFEYLITQLNYELELNFYYRENNWWGDYWGELYIQKEIFISENEKYWSDIYLSIDYNFSNDLDEFIDEIIRADKKAKDVLEKMSSQD